MQSCGYSQLRKISEVSSFETAFSANILAHLRVTDSAQTAEAQEKFAASREYVERQTGRPFFDQTWELARSSWPISTDSVSLGRSPVSVVTSVKYYDADNVDQTLNASFYQLYNPEDSAAWVWFDPEQALPDLYSRPDSVRIAFTAGHGSTIGNVPPVLREAAKSLCYFWWDNRSAVNVGNIVNELPHSFQAIITSSRIGGFIA